MCKKIDYNNLKKIIPHRYPFIILDRILDYNTDELWAVGIKNISLDEIMHHEDVYPTGLILESIGQLTGALFLLHSKNTETTFFFGTLQNIHVFKKVKLGCQLKVTTKITKIKDVFFSFQGVAMVDEEVVLKVENCIIVNDKKF